MLSEQIDIVNLLKQIKKFETYLAVSEGSSKHQRPPRNLQTSFQSPSKLDITDQNSDIELAYHIDKQAELRGRVKAKQLEAQRDKIKSVRPRDSLVSRSHNNSILPEELLVTQNADNNNTTHRRELTQVDLLEQEVLHIQDLNDGLKSIQVSERESQVKRSSRF